MKQINSMLAGCFAIAASSLPAHAELVTQGVGILDTTLNIIVTQDANLLGTMEGTTTTSYNTVVATIIAANKGTIADSPDYFDGLSKSYTLTAADFQPGGQVDYYGAIAFVKYLNSIHYGNSTHWALPAITSDDKLGYNQTGNAFGELFYTELGGVAGGAMPNGPFINIQETQKFVATYWFGDEYALNANYAWVFETTFGYQLYTQKVFPTYNYVWPIRQGPSLYTAK